MSILLGILSGLLIGSGVAIVNHLLGQKGENKRWEQHEKSLRRQWEREQRAQRERWDREDRTRFQSERLKAYRDIHKAANLENLGLRYYRFSNDYKFNSEQLSRGLEELQLCHSEILLISYSQQVSVKLSQYDRKGGQEPPLSAVKSDEWRFKNTETRCQMKLEIRPGV